MSSSSTEFVRRRRALRLGLALALLACPRPLHADRLESAVERFLGKQIAPALEQQYGLVSSPIVTEYARRIGDAVTRGAPPMRNAPRFFVLDTNEVNAIAVPGGRVYLTRGLLDAAGDEDELAAVIAHELAHQAHHHSFGHVKHALLLTLLTLPWSDGEHDSLLAGVGLADTLITLRRSRRDEAQADSTGLQITHRAGFDPRGMLVFFQRLQRMNGRQPSRWEAYFDTHPPVKDRILAVRDHPLLARADAAVQVPILRGWLARGQTQRAQRRLRFLNPDSVPPDLRDCLPPTEAHSGAAAGFPASWQGALTSLTQQTDAASQCVRAHHSRAIRYYHDTFLASQATMLRLDPGDEAWLYLRLKLWSIQKRLDNALMLVRASIIALQRPRARLQAAGRWLDEERDAQVIREGETVMRETCAVLPAVARSAAGAADATVDAMVALTPAYAILANPFRVGQLPLHRSQLGLAASAMLVAEGRTHRALELADAACAKLAAQQLAVASVALDALAGGNRLPPTQCQRIGNWFLGLDFPDCEPEQSFGRRIVEAAVRGAPQRPRDAALLLHRMLNAMFDEADSR